MKAVSMECDDVPFDALYRGVVLHRPLPPAGATLLATALKEVREHFGPQSGDLAEDDFRDALSVCRAKVSSQDFSALAARVLVEMGLAPGSIMLDQVRLRAVPRGLENVVAARPVFYPHRDTWYGNPRCQINVWIPLRAVNKLNSFRFFPHHFEHPIKNDSHLFCSTEFRELGGFGRVTRKASHQHFPRALVRAEGASWAVKLKPGGLLLFSGSHLHQTLRNHYHQPRFSLDFRFYHIDHFRQGIGAPDPDNSSQGLLIDTFRAASSVLS